MYVPPLIGRARSQASDHGFPLSSDDDVGRLLAVLAAAVPRNGRILELGTGAGVGLAWLSHGLGDRLDVDLQSVEADAALADLARSLPWPQNVTVHHGDALQVLRRGEQFDLIFADAEGGKTEGLELTIDSITIGGMLVLDDMDAKPGDALHEQLWELLVATAETVLTHPQLVAVQLDWASGVILATKTP